MSVGKPGRSQVQPSIICTCFSSLNMGPICLFLRIFLTLFEVPISQSHSVETTGASPRTTDSVFHDAKPIYPRLIPGCSSGPGNRADGPREAPLCLVKEACDAVIPGKRFRYPMGCRWLNQTASPAPRRYRGACCTHIDGDHEVFCKPRLTPDQGLGGGATGL